jgi:hypothetical protein
MITVQSGYTFAEDCAPLPVSMRDTVCRNAQASTQAGLIDAVARFRDVLNGYLHESYRWYAFRKAGCVKK